MQVPHALTDWQQNFSNILTDSKPTNSLRFRVYQTDCATRFKAYLSEYYPCLPALLGDAIWEEDICKPFIFENPPPTWNIVEWTTQLPQWLKTNQKDELSPLLLPLAEFESLQIEAYFSPPFAPSNQASFEAGIYEIRSHVRFFLNNHNFFVLREALLNGQDFILADDVYKNWIVISLNAFGDVIFMEMTPEEKECFDAFHNRTLDDALLFISETAPHLLTTLATHLGAWTTKWMNNNLLKVR